MGACYRKSSDGKREYDCANHQHKFLIENCDDG